MTITAEEMICSLAGMCNRASTTDGAGFSKMDADFGHSLAQWANQGRTWTNKQACAALKMLRKYQRQLGGKEFMDGWLKNPIFRCQPINTDVPSNNETMSHPDRVLSSNGSNAVFSFRYDAALVSDIKNIRGMHRDRKFWANWEPVSKTWLVPVNETSIWSIMDVAEKHGFTIEERFLSYLDQVREKTEESRTMLALNDGRNVVMVGNTIVISIADAAILEEFERELAES